ncbi:hypothetical protein LCGC14_1238540 [marine sediment metagenome]|uniref:Uncharacterized protein n=1 Tax=marine sediment metagenome TaxID=412755 RepID=A0A0F9LTP1_9ZZZZ
MTNEEIAKALGGNVGLGKPLLCPICSPDSMNEEQPMSSVGDFENELFCPHCDLYAEIVVTYNPDQKEGSSNESKS